MRGIVLVIDAVNVILKHLGEMPDGPEVRFSRECGLQSSNQGFVLGFVVRLPTERAPDPFDLDSVLIEKHRASSCWSAPIWTAPIVAGGAIEEERQGAHLTGLLARH